jgi:hypothetical protein
MVDLKKSPTRSGLVEGTRIKFGLMATLIAMALSASSALAATPSGILSGPTQAAVDCSPSVWDSVDDASYIDRFDSHHGPLVPVEPLARYLEIRAYDRFNGATLDARLALVAQTGVNQGWSPTVGTDTWSMSLNEMYRHTLDSKYFRENLRLVRVVVGNRDDHRSPQEQLWDGSVAPIWSDDGFSSRGREAYVLHTGQIVYPIFDFLLIVRDRPELLEEFEPGEYERILQDITEALDYHDFEWVDGPGADEGYYEHPSNYQDSPYADVPTPFNWQSAVGRALWTSYLLTGDTTHRDRAIKLAQYCKNRLQTTPDGAYIWEYYLPIDKVSQIEASWNSVSEDTGHAALSITFPIMMADHNQVFDAGDMQRFGKTIVCGFGRLGGGVLLGEINGDPGRFGPAQVSVMAPFVRISSYVPEVLTIISDYYTHFIDSEGPLDNVLLRAYTDRDRGEATAIVEEGQARPPTAELKLPYPNPFNSSVNIDYTISEAGTVGLEVFDLAGQRVDELVDEWREAGTYRAQWRDVNAASGVFLVRLRVGDYVENRKVVLVK